MELLGEYIEAYCQSGSMRFQPFGGQCGVSRLSAKYFEGQILTVDSIFSAAPQAEKVEFAVIFADPTLCKSITSAGFN